MSLHMKVHQTHDSVEYEVTWKWPITQSYTKYVLNVIKAFNSWTVCCIVRLVSVSTNESPHTAEEKKSNNDQKNWSN